MIEPKRKPSRSIDSFLLYILAWHSIYDIGMATAIDRWHSFIALKSAAAGPDSPAEHLQLIETPENQKIC